MSTLLTPEGRRAMGMADTLIQEDQPAGSVDQSNTSPEPPPLLREGSIAWDTRKYCKWVIAFHTSNPVIVQKRDQVEDVPLKEIAPLINCLAREIKQGIKFTSSGLALYRK